MPRSTRSIILNGREYDTVIEACQGSGLKPRTVYRMLHDGRAQWATPPVTGPANDTPVDEDGFDAAYQEARAAQDARLLEELLNNAPEPVPFTFPEGKHRPWVERIATPFAVFVFACVLVALLAYLM